MGYNNKLLLRKIIEIQDIVLREKKRGVTQRHVYETIIREKYLIAESTFNSYLGRNAKKELADIERREKQAQGYLNPI